MVSATLALTGPGRDHSCTFPSTEVSMTVPSRSANATEVTTAGPGRVCRCAPDAVSHIWVELSELPATTRAPSVLNATELT